jgi:hypothetical protein
MRSHSKEIADLVLKPWLLEGIWKVLPKPFAPSLVCRSSHNFEIEVQSNGEIILNAYDLNAKGHAKYFIEHLKYYKAFKLWEKIEDLSKSLQENEKNFLDCLKSKLSQIKWESNKIGDAIKIVYGGLIASAQKLESSILKELIRIKIDEKTGIEYLGFKEDKFVLGKEAEKAKDIIQKIMHDTSLLKKAEEIIKLEGQLDINMKDFKYFLNETLAYIKLGGMLEGNCEICKNAYLKIK